MQLLDGRYSEKIRALNLCFEVNYSTVAIVSFDETLDRCALPTIGQLRLQMLQYLDLRFGSLQMTAQDGIDFVTGEFRLGLEMLKRANIVEQHPEQAAMSYEKQTLGIPIAVVTHQCRDVRH